MFTGLATRVEAGVRLLDQTSPGWATKVDTRKLDVSSRKDCVLGQLFGSFTGGRNSVNLSLWEARQHGFFRLGFNYGALTRLWREAIAKRVAKVA